MFLKLVFRLKCCLSKVGDRVRSADFLHIHIDQIVYFVICIVLLLDVEGLASSMLLWYNDTD